MTVNMGLTNFVPMISQWQLQSENDIYDSFNDWNLHRFLCIMKDGKEVWANGIADENPMGFGMKYVDFEEDDYTYDDIVYWLEIPCPPDLDKLEIYKEAVSETIKSTRKQYTDEIQKVQEKLKQDLISHLEEQIEYSTSPSCTSGMKLFIQSIKNWKFIN